MLGKHLSYKLQLYVSFLFGCASSTAGEGLGTASKRVASGYEWFPLCRDIFSSAENACHSYARDPLTLEDVVSGLLGTFALLTSHERRTNCRVLCEHFIIVPPHPMPVLPSQQNYTRGNPEFTMI